MRNSLYLRTAFLAILLGSLGGWVAPALADDGGFGPGAWPEYRLRPSNNAVFDNGGKALPVRHYALNGQVRATPVIVGNRLYIGAHDSGGLYAFDVRTGKQIWGAMAPDWRHAPNWVHSDMVFSGGRIYLGYGNRHFRNSQIRGTGASGVLCIDPDTGATIWNHHTVGEVMPTPAVDHGIVYAATGAGKLLALDARSGRLAWQLDLPGWVSMSSPNIQGGTLYVGALNAVVAVDLKTHHKRWTFHAQGSFTDVSPAVSADDTVVTTARVEHSQLTAEDRRHYPGLNQNLHFIYAFNGRTGQLLWRRLMGSGPDQKHNTSGAPAIHGNTIYVGSPYTDSFMAFDLHSGQKLWEYKTNTAIKGAPVIDHGHVFFGDTQGFLYVLDAKTGRLARSGNGRVIRPRKVGGSLSSAKNTALAPAGPVIINQNLFIGSQDGFVYSFPLQMLLHPDTATGS